MRHLVALFILVTIAKHAQATMAYFEKAVLPEADVAQLESLICLKPFKLKADRIQGYKFQDARYGTGIRSAVVQCQSHSEFMKSPIHYQAQCSIDEGKWVCGETKLEMAAKLINKDIKIRSLNMPIESAYNILSTISTYGSYQGISMKEAIGSQCDISQSEDKETIELDCKYKITVSTWCPQPEFTQCPRVVFVTEPPMI